MTINAEVVKNEAESDISLIRRFSRRMQGSGIVQKIRGRRYFSRIKSRTVRRSHTLKVIKRREETAELIKLGKMPERPVRGPRRR